MYYDIKNHPTKYADVLFRSRLEARWAAFFDLLKWEWEYEPTDFQGWVPDFLLPKYYSGNGYNGSYELYCEIKPYRHIVEFDNHPANNPGYGCLGISPSVTKVWIVRESGYEIHGLMDFDSLVKTAYFFASGNFDPAFSITKEDAITSLWRIAGNKTQWKPGE